MAGTKAEAAAVAYHAIHEQLSEFDPYVDRLCFVNEVIEILEGMAKAEWQQYLDAQPRTESKEVE